MKKIKVFKEVIKRIENRDLEVDTDYFRYEGLRISYSQLGIATIISNYERRARTLLYFVYNSIGRLEGVGLSADTDPAIPEDIYIAFEELSGKQADKLYRMLGPLTRMMFNAYKELYQIGGMRDNTIDIDKCKKLIEKWVAKGVNSGFYDCRNIVGDDMDILFESSGLRLEVCYNWGYFECFANKETFEILKAYYNKKVNKC